VANRQRLLWVLSQVLQRHLPVAMSTGEVDETTGQQEGHDDAA